MLTIGLTGGIGSGKSTVAQMLVSAGCTLIDADLIARQASEPGGRAIPKLREAFGAALVLPDGRMDRDLMRRMILEDPNAKVRLESIVHPIVAQEINAQRHKAALSGCKRLILDIPLLVEGGARWRRQLDVVWVVDCRVETQIERVAHRNGWPRVQIEAVLAVQASRRHRLSCADTVIDNDSITFGALEVLVLQALKFSEAVVTPEFRL